MGDWNFQFEPVCLPEEIADPFFEEDTTTDDTRLEEAAVLSAEGELHEA